MEIEGSVNRPPGHARPACRPLRVLLQVDSCWRECTDHVRQSSAIKAVRTCLVTVSILLRHEGAVSARLLTSGRDEKRFDGVVSKPNVMKERFLVLEEPAHTMVCESTEQLR